ncbi:MAG: chemotaxis protein CheW [Spirochaetes bacterium]|nr:chemotaxis protein CheW [Spirochaetota bacterium]
MKKVIQINTCGLDFIVLREDISTIVKDRIIYHLPLSGKTVSGISEIDGRVLTFLDFSVSIGLKYTSERKEKHLIILSETDIAGFAVSGNIEEAAVSEDEIVPVHPFIKNQIIDKIVIKNRNLIPVINIKKLYEYIKQNYQPFEFIPAAEYNSCLKVDRSDSHYIVNSGSDTFAFFSGQSDDTPESISKIIPLSILPSIITGVSLFKDDIIPLFNTGIAVGSGNRSKAELMLPLDLNGKIGFAFDSLKYENSVNPEQVSLLPLLIQTKYMHYAVRYDSSIYCVVEPENLLAWISEKSEEIDLNERYAPDSSNQLKKQKEPVNVIEILFSEAVHSVPEMEVADVFPITAYFKVPNCKSIVAGIAEYEGELLPVIDPAACYGLKSSPGEDWKMLLVKNGDFRCLLLTESVYSTKKIQVKDQRELPVKLAHNFVYICYPDIETDNIRLVLNIEAIAVYFKDSMAAEISKLFLNRESREVPKAFTPETAGDVSAIIEEKKEVDIHTYEELIFDKTNTVESSDHSDSDNLEQEEVEEDYAEIMEPEQEESTEPEEAEFDGVNNLETDKTEYEDSEEADNQKFFSYDLEETNEMRSNSLQEYDLTDNDTAESDSAGYDKADEKNEETGIETGFNPAEYLRSSENLDEEEIEFLPVEEDEAPASVAASSTFVYDKVNDFNNQSEKSGTSDTEKESDVWHKETENKVIIDTVPGKTEAESVKIEFSDDENQKSGKSVTQILSSGISRFSGKVKDCIRTQKKHKLIIDLIFIVITILVLLFIIFSSSSRLFKKFQNNIETEKSSIESSSNEISNENRLEEPVQQTSPVNVKKDSTEFIYKLYNVKKGDTLYEITEEFTGDGFDYPEVARDNDIPDPDLIFPKQTIKIKVRKESQK